MTYTWSRLSAEVQTGNQNGEERWLKALFRLSVQIRFLGIYMIEIQSDLASENSQKKKKKIAWNAVYIHIAFL